MHKHLSCTLSRLSSSEPVAIIRVSWCLPGLHPIHLYWFRTGMTDVLLPRQRPLRPLHPSKTAAASTRSNQMISACMIPDVEDFVAKLAYGRWMPIVCRAGTGFDLLALTLGTQLQRYATRSGLPSCSPAVLTPKRKPLATSPRENASAAHMPQKAW